MILKQLKMKIRFINTKRIFRKLYFIFKILILITVVHLLINVYFFQNTKSDRQNDADLLFKNKNLKYVQLLTGRFDYINWALPNLGEEAFKNCKEKRCFAFKPFTIRQKPLEQSDAILVHAPNLYYMPNKKTYKRNRKQLWMYYSMESPRGTYCSMHYKPTELDDWFNLTATYKQDSNFVTGIELVFIFREQNFFSQVVLQSNTEYDSMRHYILIVQKYLMILKRFKVHWVNNLIPIGFSSSL